MLLDLNFLSYSFLIAALSSFLLGIAKAGVKGVSALIVTGLALAYGAKESTGILMPLLICGDIFAVSYYKRHVKWRYIIKLIPWMILGVLFGVITGNNISDNALTVADLNQDGTVNVADIILVVNIILGFNG